MGMGRGCDGESGELTFRMMSGALRAILPVGLCCGGNDPFELVVTIFAVVFVDRHRCLPG